MQMVLSEHVNGQSTVSASTNASRASGIVHLAVTSGCAQRDVAATSCSSPAPSSPQANLRQSTVGVWIEQTPKSVNSPHCLAVSSNIFVPSRSGIQQNFPQYISSMKNMRPAQPLSPASYISMIPAVLHQKGCNADAKAIAIDTSVSSEWTGRSCLLNQLPIEILQLTMDLLPTFGERVRLCRVSKLAVTSLEWRLAPPLEPSEEMSGLDLGDMGARAVALALVKPQHSPIGELSLGNNNIGNTGALAISTLLGAGCAIRRLSLRDNAIGDAGAHALAAALADNTSLEELDLWGNNITSGAKAALLATTKCKVFLELGVAPLRPSPWVKLADGRMRTVLFEWISQVQTGGGEGLDGEADPQDLLFRTFSLIDAYFSFRRVKQSELQLIGVACMMAATSKTNAASDQDLASWLAFVTGEACTADEVKEAVRRVTKVLGFKMHKPTAYTFLRRYLRKTGWTQESFSFANYMIELAVMNADFCKYSPQVIAAAATVLSRQYLTQGIGYQNIAGWKAKLLKSAQVDVLQELAPCMAALSRLHVAEHGRPYRFVNKKYMWQGLHKVANIKPNAPGDAPHFVAYLSN